MEFYLRMTFNFDDFQPLTSNLFTSSSDDGGFKRCAGQATAGAALASTGAFASAYPAAHPSVPAAAASASSVGLNGGSFRLRMRSGSPPRRSGRFRRRCSGRPRQLGCLLRINEEKLYRVVSSATLTGLILNKMQCFSLWSARNRSSMIKLDMTFSHPY